MCNIQFAIPEIDNWEQGLQYIAEMEQPHNMYVHLSLTNEYAERLYRTLCYQINLIFTQSRTCVTINCGSVSITLTESCVSSLANKKLKSN